MKQKLNRIILISMIMLLTALPAYADLVFCGKKLAPGATPNELDGTLPCTFTNMFQLIYTVVNYLISGAGLVAIFFIVLGGAQLLISAGNETKIKEAKDTIRNAILGLILVLISYMVIGYIVGLILPGASDPLESLLNMFRP